MEVLAALPKTQMKPTLRQTYARIFALLTLGMLTGIFLLAVAHEEPTIAGSLLVLQSEEGIAKVVLSVVADAEVVRTPFGTLQKLVTLRKQSLFAKEIKLAEAQELMSGTVFPFKVDNRDIILDVKQPHAMQIGDTARAGHVMTFSAAVSPPITAPRMLVWTSVARTRVRIPNAVQRFYAKIPEQPEGGYWLYALRQPLSSFDVAVVLPAAARVDIDAALAREIVLEKLQGFNIAVLEPNTLTPVLMQFTLSDIVSALEPQTEVTTQK